MATNACIFCQIAKGDAPIPPAGSGPQAGARTGGLRVLQLNGAEAGHTVSHYPMHLLPKNADEPDIGPAVLRDRRMAEPEELKSLAALRRAALS